jgi:hypothetical protein
VTPCILFGWDWRDLTLYHPKTRIATITTPTTEPATIPAMGVDFDGDGVGVGDDDREGKGVGVGFGLGIVLDDE